ncbi:mannose-1-phosphate guanylyltransferase/mannose-6-phosphate isomerase, partial [Francisella tularensis subsp. holarctica]|nr:mannose-1-phosphate guanylyltransferase/mannose-6-phosphate isomerase [Francisella tularensis subsp. holarctica]
NSNVKNSYLRSLDRFLAAVGVNDLIIVETADAIIVADKNKNQDVKKIVEVLKIQQLSELLQHKQIYKSGGSATILEDKSGYK